MLVLTSTEKLQLVLSAGTADVDVNYNDRTATAYGPSDSQQTAATAATNDICAAPAASTSREINGLSIYCKTTGGTATLQKFNSSGSVTTIIAKGTIAVGDNVFFTHGDSLKAFDTSFNLKETLVAATNWGVTGNLTVGGNTTLGDAAADSLTVNAGVFSAPNIPAFAAYVSSTINNVTGAGAAYNVVFDTEIFDQNSNFNNATGIFTAPVTGRYFFSCAVRLTGTTALATNLQVVLVTSNRNWAFIYLDKVLNTDDMSVGGSAVIDMDAADTAKVQVILSGMAADTADVLGTSNAASYFCGHQAA